MEDREWLQPDTQNLFTDASNMGGGATYNTYFTTFNWSRHMNLTEYSIQLRELLTSLIAFLTFSPVLTQRRLILWTDNQSNAEAFYDIVTLGA